MFRIDIDRIVHDARVIFHRELDIAKELLGFHHPEDPRHHHRRRHHHRHHPHQTDTILFEYLFPNLSILQPMGIAKNNGPFDGALVFKNAAGDVIPISGVTNPALVIAENAATTGTGSVTLNPDGTFSGTGADGDLVLVATATNDKGDTITGTNTITFTAVIVPPDTTATSIDVNVN